MPRTRAASSCSVPLPTSRRAAVLRGASGREGRRRRPAALVLAVLLASGAPGVRAATPSPARGEAGMVVTSQVDATRAGHAMLEAGGNAIDAAVASAFALSVTQPFSSGLGGGCFALVRIAADGATPARIVAIDARETAPAAATRDMYVQPGVDARASVAGALAVATPGLVAGLVHLQEAYGALPLATVMAPAIALARDGFAIGPYHAAMIEAMRARMPADDPRFAETARIQFPPPGEAAAPGWRLAQPELAATLELVARGGARAFYDGAPARAIAATMRAHGGLVTEEDLARYAVVEREPTRGHYRGLEVASFPPPSSGGVVLQEILNVLEGFDLAARPAHGSASIHVIAEAMKLAFADRAVFLGDPDFVDVPVERLLSPAHADAQRARILPPRWRRAPWTWLRDESAIRVEAPGLPQDDAGTTHLSTTDARGNAVALTKTINTPYGSGVTVPGTGIVLNDEMDDFAKAPDAPNAYGLIDVRGANAIAPGKRPLSSMTPTLLLRDGKPFMVTGSPGGPRIISTTLLTILDVVDYGMDVQAAVSAPRFHHQWVPDTLYVEPETPQDVVEGLEARGHDVERSASTWSAAEAIVIDPRTGIHFGGSDPRRDGLALGYSPQASAAAR
ncbi:MAG: gamma-glutamyltransferase [Myxococcales bacterium]|nr:gamma-glutamyltransferase [Myxococcales bacterium]